MGCYGILMGAIMVVIATINWDDNPILIATNTHANQEELQPQSTITMMMEITSMGNNRNVAKYSIQILALFKTHPAKQHYKLSSYFPSTKMFLNIPITSTNMSNCKTYSFVSKLYRHKIGLFFPVSPAQSQIIHYFLVSTSVKFNCSC